MTKGKPGSRIAYFSANPNGEAETIRVILKPKPRLRILQFEKDFSEIEIRGRGTIGNILTKADVHRIQLKQKGLSTLGGRKVWYDPDVFRLNYEGGGKYLGEFQGDDMILVVTKSGDFYKCNFDLSNHFPDDVLIVEKFDEHKVWTAALYDADQGYAYLKRFTMDATEKPLNFMGENSESRLFLLTDVVYPRVKAIFGGNDSFREPIELDAEEFIGEKSYKAKGKRISNFEVETVIELEPVRFPEPVNKESSTKVEIDEEGSENGNENISDSDLRDEISGQMKLFD